jgi:hypothetical protein
MKLSVFITLALPTAYAISVTKSRNTVSGNSKSPGTPPDGLIDLTPCNNPQTLQCTRDNKKHVVTFQCFPAEYGMVQCTVYEGPTKSDNFTGLEPEYPGKLCPRPKNMDHIAPE